MVQPLLRFSYESLSTHVAESLIVASPTLVEIIQTSVAKKYSSYTALPGFADALPTSYTQDYFVKEIHNDTQQFIFKHFVINHLLQELHKHKIIFANWPRLVKVVTDPIEQTLAYSFKLSRAPSVELKEWRHFIFKSPRRKNYKDLDKQVMAFLKSETDLFKQQNHTQVESGDWVNFFVTLVDDKHTPLFPAVSHSYWLHVTTDSIKSDLQCLFLNKELSTPFITASLPFSTLVDTSLQDPCYFKLSIRNIVKGKHLSVDYFKSTFKLKSKADVHRKLIEVFSYRNDISQRKAIIEELFHLLFTKHRFEAPKHVITRKKELIVNTLKKQPDYHVYRGHRDFTKYIETLAEKLLKEEIIIDTIAYTENLSINAHDIEQYLYLFNNERLKEFIYFKPIIDNIEEIDAPIHESILMQAVLREKTLNHVIHILS